MTVGAQHSAPYSRHRSPPPDTGGTSHESSSVTSPRKMLTTVRKENHCAIAVNRVAVRVICIALRKRNAEGAHRKSYVPRVSIEKCLYIGRNQRDKQFARWQVRLNISASTERATRSKPCSPNSSNRSSCAGCDYDDCGTSLSSST